jgi:hypothetical protein
MRIRWEKREAREWTCGVAGADDDGARRTAAHAGWRRGEGLRMAWMAAH